MSDPDPPFKSEVNSIVDEFQEVADQLRARIAQDKAATAGSVKIYMMVIACGICLLFGFIAGYFLYLPAGHLR